MPRLLDVHTRLARVALRLFLLQLLWLLHTLRGGIVLGAFPATAAVHAVLRRDMLHPAGPARGGLWREFDDQWRGAFWPANRLGFPLLLVWVLLLTEHRALTVAAARGLGAGVGAVLWFAMALLFVVTSCVWMLAAHFEGGTLHLLRRAVALALGRPVVAVGTALGVALVLCGYYVVPGLVPVLGVALPAWVSVQVLWHSGVLPHPADEAVTVGDRLEVVS